MKNNSITIWEPIEDDNLVMVDQAVQFLQAEYCPEDLEPIWSIDYFHWKLGDANPAGKGYLSLAIADGRVVGTVSITKKRALLEGKEIICGEVGDSYSSAAVRRRSKSCSLSDFDNNPKSYINRSIFGRLAMEARKRAEQDGVHIIYGTPNNKAYPGWTKRLGYFHLDKYSNTTMSRPTMNMLVKKIPLLGLVKFILLGIEKIFNLFLLLINRYLSRGQVHIKKKWPSDSELNDLWKRVLPAKGFSLIRDAVYWQHRYNMQPLAEYRLFSIWDADILRGVIVARLYSGPDGKRVVSILEWMCDESVRFEYILAEVINSYDLSTVDVFNMWVDKDCNDAKSALKCLFLYRHDNPIIISDTLEGRSLEKALPDFKFYLGTADAA